MALIKRVIPGRSGGAGDGGGTGLCLILKIHTHPVERALIFESAPPLKKLNVQQEEMMRKHKSLMPRRWMIFTQGVHKATRLLSGRGSVDISS